MGWEERGGRMYYYRKRRDGDRVVSAYVGAGAFVDTLERLGVLHRARMRLERETARRERESLLGRDRAVRAVLKDIRRLTEAVLLAKGYHTHKGQWRKRRRGNTMDREQRTQVRNQRVFDILKATNKSNPKAEDVAALRALLREKPELWRRVAGLAQQTQGQIIESLAGKTALTREALQHGLRILREDLGHAEASPLERLLIEQVVLCWLDYHEAQRRHHLMIKGGTSFANAGWLEKRLNGAHRRYVRSMQALARVRKMGVAVQINVAEQQVNVAEQQVNVGG